MVLLLYGYINLNQVQKYQAMYNSAHIKINFRQLVAINGHADIYICLVYYTQYVLFSIYIIML